MKLYIEMTDKEYEEYKQFLNGTHPSQEHGNLNIGMIEFLKMKGFKESDHNSFFDIATWKNFHVADFVKNDTVITIRAHD